MKKTIKKMTFSEMRRMDAKEWHEIDEDTIINRPRRAMRGHHSMGTVPDTTRTNS